MRRRNFIVSVLCLITIPFLTACENEDEKKKKEQEEADRKAINPEHKAEKSIRKGY